MSDLGIMGLLLLVDFNDYDGEWSAAQAILHLLEKVNPEKFAESNFHECVRMFQESLKTGQHMHASSWIHEQIDRLNIEGVSVYFISECTIGRIANCRRNATPVEQAKE